MPLFAKGAPTARDATLLEVRYALETLAQRTLGCSRDRVTTVLKRHGDLADAAAKLLLKRPVGRGDGGDVKELLASVDAVSDEAEKIILAEVVRHATTCLQTNVGRADRQALALVLDPSTLSDGAEPPARVVFVAGRRFDAFHVSMRPVARGGVRLVTPKNAGGALAAAAARHYDECRDLAQAQQLKNKDIPEGGAKAVVLVDATGHGDDAWAGRGRGAFREYLNRKAVSAFADALLDVSLESETLPYFGPDEQVVPQDITRIVANAARRGHPRPEALMSSKPGAGINHKEFGVTSEGVGGLRRAGAARGRDRRAQGRVPRVFSRRSGRRRGRQLAEDHATRLAVGARRRRGGRQRLRRGPRRFRWERAPALGRGLGADRVV